MTGPNAESLLSLRKRVSKWCQLKYAALAVIDMEQRDGADSEILGVQDA